MKTDTLSIYKLQLTACRKNIQLLQADLCELSAICHREPLESILDDLRTHEAILNEHVKVIEKSSFSTYISAKGSTVDIKGVKDILKARGSNHSIGEFLHANGHRIVYKTTDVVNWLASK